MGTAALYQSATTGAGGITFPANTSRYSRAGAGAFFTANAYEWQSDAIWRTPGVWSDLWVRVTQNTFDLTSNVFSRVNGADGNQTVAIGAGLTGIFHDAVNTDAIAAGDLVDYRVFCGHSAPSATGFQCSIFQSLFTATADERVYRLTSGTSNTALSTGFGSCMGGFPCDVLEWPLQIHVPAGTLRNAAHEVIINTRTGTSQLVLRLNEVDTDLVVDIPAGLTGIFEDLTHTVSVVDRDRLAWRFRLGGASGLYFVNFAGLVDLVTTVFFGGGSRTSAGITLVGSAGDSRKDGAGPQSGWHNQVTLADEAEVQAEVLVTDTWEGIIVVVPQNGQNGSCEWISRLNGADSTLVVTVPAFLTGTFESVGASIAVTPTDLIDIRRKANGTNSAELNYFTHNFFGIGGGEPPGPVVTDCDDVALVAINLALLNLGISRTIETLADLNREAFAGHLQFDHQLRAVLRTHPWPFATKYATLVLHDGELADPVQPDWLFAYEYPSDCVFARRIVSSATGRTFDATPIPFRVGREETTKVIYTNEDQSTVPAVACLEYTTRASCPLALDDELFMDALVWRLTAALAPALSQIRKRHETAWIMYLHTLATAGAVTMNEGQQELEGDAAWIRDRA